MIFPRNADRIVGIVGGIEFHVLKYVSLTHSSASSLLPRIFFAIEVQYFPYFFAVADNAVSYTHLTLPTNSRE